MHTNQVQVVSFSKEWKTLFQKEKELLESHLNLSCGSFLHIGSTSINKCAAKPVIDILGVTKDVTQLDLIPHLFEELGYTVKGEFGMPQRRFYQKRGETSVNLHIFEDTDPEVARHLRFCRYLNHSSFRKWMYVRLKRKLAKRYPQDIMSYCLGKDRLVKKIDILAAKERVDSPLFSGERKLIWEQSELIRAVENHLYFYLIDLLRTHPQIEWVFHEKSFILRSKKLPFNRVVFPQMDRLSSDEIINILQRFVGYTKQVEVWLTPEYLSDMSSFDSVQNVETVRAYICNLKSAVSITHVERLQDLQVIKIYDSKLTMQNVKKFPAFVFSDSSPWYFIQVSGYRVMVGFFANMMGIYLFEEILSEEALESLFAWGYEKGYRKGVIYSQKELTHVGVSSLHFLKLTVTPI